MSSILFIPHACRPSSGSGLGIQVIFVVNFTSLIADPCIRDEIDWAAKATALEESWVTES
jgi:hypothetical protein